jgi:predicted cupin superfamily sugar epimerase
MLTREFLIEHFQLAPLTIEGGMFNLFYRNPEQIPAEALPARYTHAKATSNSIVYLHQPQTCSVMHRLRTDEIYHFYHGDPVTVLLLYPDGHSETRVLGHAYDRAEEPFLVVPQNVWQGSFLNEGGAWALIGCSLAPAYDDDDFELGAREPLCAQYPGAAELIRRLTPDNVQALLATDPRKAGVIRLQTS